MAIPKLSKQEIEKYVSRAKNSERRRALKILHKPGAEFNEAVNFMLSDSYMQPHRHPSPEKIEKILVLQGKIGQIFFDDSGKIKKCVLLEAGGNDYVEIPAFAWHTYVIFSDYAVTYETMTGVYDPATWKESAKWAPQENTAASAAYLESLKRSCAAGL